MNQYEPNKIYTDEFGRPSGIFLVDKPIGKTSHDMVYEYRRKLQTKKVGHAGALDPFASGLLIILAGKALKLSESFLTLPKEYEADVALGFRTDTLDTEGKIVESSKLQDLTSSEEDIKNALNSFMPGYLQDVPIYSSVKVQGDKLRELVRKADDHKIIKQEDGSSKVQFLRQGEVWKEVNIPQKEVKIYGLDLLELKKVSVKDYNFDDHFKEELQNNNITEFYSLKIRAHVSKGTYIRKLAEAIGEKLEVPGMLVGLRRTKVGDFSLEID